MPCDVEITYDAVANLLKIDPSSELELSVQSAVCVIDELMADCASSWTTKKANLIGADLAAHYYASVNLHASMINSTSANGSSESYNRRKAEVGFKSTPFGLAALSLDSTGCLKEYDEQTEYRSPTIAFGGNEDGDGKRRCPDVVE